MLQLNSAVATLHIFQIIEGLQRLDGQIREVLKLDSEVRELAKDLYHQKSLLIMGRGYNFATCLEGALVSRNCATLIVYAVCKMICRK